MADERGRGRKRGREGEREREKKRGREGERERGREGERERGREGERERVQEKREGERREGERVCVREITCYVKKPSSNETTVGSCPGRHSCVPPQKCCSSLKRENSQTVREGVSYKITS